MFSSILAFHVIIAAVLVVIILLQHGKGADMGAAFGSGASGTVFGSAGSGSFLSKLTGWLGAAFFITSMVLAMLAATQGGSGSVAIDAVDDTPIEAPARPAPPERGEAPPAPPRD